MQHWPGPGKDESHSSSDEQTAFEQHSHHSRQSREGYPVSPVTDATRAIKVRPRDPPKAGRPNTGLV